MTVAGPTQQLTEARRVRQSADVKAEPEDLLPLAGDSSVTVRAALALNPAAPQALNRALLHDPDERVRALLARRLAGLLPDVGGDEQLRLQGETYRLLTQLVADTAMRVRGAVADVLKDMPHAPRALILELAHDPAVMVSAPIIRFSPLLTSRDLLALIAAAPSPGTTIAVAGRPGIDAQVSDAIAATADSAAIRALLCNRTAQIREATLDALIEQAADHPEWHEPLVRQPLLPPRAAHALADIVATHLVEVLAQRADLPASLAHTLQQRLQSRLEVATPHYHEPTHAEALAQAEALARAGQLDEAAVLAAAGDGDMVLTTALLTVAAGVPLSVVERAASLRSAKGLVSLAWRAGFTMRAAVALQPLLGRLGPDATLASGPGGSFPLAIEEMRWQLDFLGRMGR
jgi:uncharacterized protein (DUF2336 family)